MVIAKWKDGHIAGKYFIFNPDYLSTENKGNKLPAEVCFYGSMENGMLEGDNYIASLGGFRAKGVFRNGKLNG